VTNRTITVIGFAAVITALAVLEILGRRPGSRIPTLGEWLGYVMRPKTGRALILLGWLWLGWHYFARLAGPAAASSTAALALPTDRPARHLTRCQVSLSCAA
jgi:hypothetical protein